jgi:6-pyruvoyltetrahydropterin/6-carboxytetrahydropterin synthase
MQTITRKGTFDAAHRVMDERVKCFNLHGHTYLYELTFGFRQLQDIGFAIDFKDIKTLAGEFIDKTYDHAAIMNPADIELIEIVKRNGWNLYIMSFDDVYCNPTVENISKEVFLAVSSLMDSPNLQLVSLRIYETPNAFCDTHASDISVPERAAWKAKNGKRVEDFLVRLLNKEAGFDIKRETSR